jgi:moderate conductance mechanosensitive channel
LFPSTLAWRLSGLVAGLALVMAGSSLAMAQVPGTSLPGPASAEKSPSATGTPSAAFELRLPTVSELRAWAVEHTFSVVAIIAVVLVILWLAAILDDRIIALLARRNDRGTAEERENRAKTLVGVLHNALRTTAIVVGFTMILQEFNVPIGPLLGGVAVIGLAVAFGAQSLIKDYFTGFMVLLEQQYMIGDVIQIGPISGQVENITLRLTVLRDLEGKVHFIPHGQITIVTNMTHGWSRAVFDIGIAYGEDAERAIGVLLQLAAELRQDPTFGPSIIGDAEMYGVDTLGDSAVILKFGIKTLPTKRWDIKRELLKRIKHKFDELKIEIPFPQRTTWVRYEGKEEGVGVGSRENQ